MENKNVGYMILGISILIILIIFMYENTLTEFVDSSCTAAHGEGQCPMYDTINQQTNLSLGIVALLIIVGIMLIRSKPEEKTIIKEVEVEKPKKEIDTSELNSEEKEVLNLIKENKAMFQADIIEKTGYGKVKMTRIIDRLEGKDIVERKRRGMNNIVVMKN